MNWIRFPQKPLAKAIAAVVVAGGIGVSAPAVFAATAAGTVIKNLATVTYEDAAGFTYSVESNEAIVTVAQVYSATVGVDVDVSAAPGQTVYLPYVLTNTGNGTDTFDLTALDGITGNDNIDAENITIYEDSNGNGEPDASEVPITSLTLPANVNNIANLVVAVEVPVTATDGQTLGVTLTAQAYEGGAASVLSSVTDLSAGSGRDGLAGTNESLITVTGDAVLVATKSSVHDVEANEITYTVTVENKGNTAANNVVIFDGLPANTELVSFSASGILGTNGDTEATSAVLNEVGLSLDLNGDTNISATDEATFGLDLNNDGDTSDGSVDGVYAIDSVLPAQAEVSVTFTVKYVPETLGGGYVIENQGFVSGDTNEDNVPDTFTSSNTVQDAVNPSFGVVISDTGIGRDDGVNDGGDDDETVNDDQFVDAIAAGGIVVFTTVVTNNGNADDIFELSVDPGNFPAESIFSFYDSSGTVLLSDTNGSDVDTGVIASGASTEIVVKVQLPASASGDAPGAATEYEATVKAVSANDPSATEDTTSISLGTIVSAASDLHNAADGTIGNDEDPLGVAPYTAANGYVGSAGTTINIPLYIDNESGAPDSYSLSVGSSWNGSTLGSLPSGWTVEFYPGDGAGNPIGDAISETSLLPGLTVNHEVIAVVSIPADGGLSINDYSADNNGDGTADVLDANNDGDGDYPLFFQILSQTTGSTDTVLDGVDVDTERELTLVNPLANQIEAGGTVVYDHTLANNGNVDEVVVISATNSAAGWTNSLSVDTDGDGDADTPINALAPGQITVLQTDGSTATITVTDADGDSIAEQFNLAPGINLLISASVSAPSGASAGVSDYLTITVTNVDTVAGPNASLTDQTTVIDGTVSLTKTVAADLDCNGEADGDFDAVQATEIAPGQCAIWQVVAENLGAADASNVIIYDPVPAFSAFEPSSLKYCLSNGCDLDQDPPISDVAGDDAGEISGNTVVFYVGIGANPNASEGGVLVPGEKATAQFSVRVQ